MSQIKKLLIAFFALGTSVLSSAHVTPVATRVIFQGGAAFTSVEVHNNDPQNAYGLESWVSNSDAKNPLQVMPNSNDHAFIISPKFSIIPPKNKVVILHIIKLPDTKLAQDRESLFYLEFQEAPPQQTINQLLGKKDQHNLSGGINIAVHSQIKMIYRPKVIPPLSGANFKGKLKIKIYGDQAIIDNQSPYVLNTLNLYTFEPTQAQLNDFNKQLSDKSYIAHAPIFLPYTQTYLKLAKSLPATAPKTLYLEYINDYGGYDFAPITLNTASSALFSKDKTPKSDQVIGNHKN